MFSLETAVTLEATMFMLLASYHAIVSDAGTRYRPRAYAGSNQDESWSGYLVFFPLLAPATAASTPADVTSPTMDGIRRWASSLNTDDLHDALQRALALERSADVEERLAILKAAEDHATLEAVTRADVEAALDHRIAQLRDTIAQEEHFQAEELRDEAERAAAAAVAARARADAMLGDMTTQLPDAAADAGRRRTTKKKR